MEISHKKLTYDELIEILANITVRVERLEKKFDLLLDEILDHLKEKESWDEYVGVLILQNEIKSINRTDKMKTSLRYANKRITELNNSHHGLIAYLNENVISPAKKKGKVPEITDFTDVTDFAGNTEI